jgi:NapC/NirT cytochrome c family, N-terminal region
MTAPQPSNNDRPGTRRARSRRARPRPPTLLERWRSLKGWTRVATTGALVIVVIGIIAASGGTAYAIQLENQDGFCASCHTQPEVKYYQQSQAANAVSLAAFHTQKGVRCIDCHSGGGPIGRVDGVSQGARDALAYYTGNYRSPAVTTNPLGDGSCTKCHADSMTQQTFNNHFHLFLARWQSIDPNAAHCVDCHTSHPSGASDQQYLDATAVRAVCDQCHTALGAGG